MCTHAREKTSSFSDSLACTDEDSLLWLSISVVTGVVEATIEVMSIGGEGIAVVEVTPVEEDIVGKCTEGADGKQQVDKEDGNETGEENAEEACITYWR